MISGVGYNYRWVPLVHVRPQLDRRPGALGEITNYCGRFFSMYGSDPLGLLSWRFLADEARLRRVERHPQPRRRPRPPCSVGPITEVVGTGETFIRQRPLPTGAAAPTTPAAGPDDPTGEVTNEDYAGALVVFASGARGTFEAPGRWSGRRARRRSRSTAPGARSRWNLEKINELQVYLVDDDLAPRGYTTVYGGDRYPYHGHFVPGDANRIGFEDVVTIEDYAFLDVGRRRASSTSPGLDEARRLRQLPGRLAALVRRRASGRT